MTPYRDTDGYRRLWEAIDRVSMGDGWESWEVDVVCDAVIAAFPEILPPENRPLPAPREPDREPLTAAPDDVETQAGQRLLAEWSAGLLNGLDRASITDLILEIEAEARYLRPNRPRLVVTVEGACIYTDWSLDRQGYGHRRVKGRSIRAHRVAWSDVNGPIPAGLTIDHLCHDADPDCPGALGCLHRRCVNPAHLEAVTNQENVSRAHGTRRPRDYCAKGHRLEGEGVRVGWRGSGKFMRSCVECERLTAERRKEREANRPRRATKPIPAFTAAEVREFPTCNKGLHPMTPANTYVRPDNRHACRACLRNRAAVRRLEASGG